MFRKYLTLAVVGAIVAALAIAFAPAEDRFSVIGAFALTFLVAAALTARTVRRFAVGRPRAVIVAGIGLCVMSFGLMITSPGAPPAGHGLADQGPGLLLLAGLWLVMLPFAARRVASDLALMQGEPPLASGDFAPWAEVQASVEALIRRNGPLLRLVGPWFLFVCLASLVFADPYWSALLGRRRDLIYAILAGALSIVLLSLLASFVAAIQWTRFSATGREPALTDFPGRALWGWTWRWFVYGALFRSLNKLHPWLLTHLPTAAPWQAAGVEAVIKLAAMVIFSPFALIFPAVALDAANKGVTVSMRGYRLVGPRYLLGAAIILAPYSAAMWALDATSNPDQSQATTAARIVVSTLLAFATLIVGATYATGVYLRGAPLKGGGETDISPA